MDINLIVNISSRAWAMDILALLHDGVPARQAPLLARTGASRTAFLQSLHYLIEMKFLERNPSHGHPLRPEYRLTDNGVKAARVAYNIYSLNISASERPILRRSWTVPILVLTQEPRYFTDIKLGLGKITDRALSQSIQQLQDHDWLSREVDVHARPLRPLYSTKNLGAQIGAAAQV